MDLNLDRDFLMWIHERLEKQHGNSELFDFMHRLRAIILSIPKDVSHRTTPFACNGLDELQKWIEENEN